MKFTRNPLKFKDSLSTPKQRFETRARHIGHVCRQAFHLVRKVAYLRFQFPYLPFVILKSHAGSLSPEAIETPDPGKPGTDVHNGCEEVNPQLIADLSGNGEMWQEVQRFRAIVVLDWEFQGQRQVHIIQPCGMTWKDGRLVGVSELQPETPIWRAVRLIPHEE